MNVKKFAQDVLNQTTGPYQKAGPIAPVWLEFVYAIDGRMSVDTVAERAELVRCSMLDAEDHEPGLTDSAVVTSGHRVAVSVRLARPSPGLAALRLREIVQAAMYDVAAFGFAACGEVTVYDLAGADGPGPVPST